MIQWTKLGLCADHAGYEVKEFIKTVLADYGVEFVDYGTHSQERCDYPDFAHAMAADIDRGVLPGGIAVCGSGNGISMALNKHPRVRAALCWAPELATLARAHNDANVLSIPGRFVSHDICRQIVTQFLTEQFEGGRHTDRIAKIPL